MADDATLSLQAEAIWKLLFDYIANEDGPD